MSKRVWIAGLVGGLVVAALLSLTRLTGFVRRAGFFAGVGVIAAVATNAAYWLWYGFPAPYSLTAMAVDLIKFAVAGLAAAAVLDWSPRLR